MPIPKGSKRVYFPRVAEAREALREKALETYERQIRLIEAAAEAGEFEAALSANEWLIEHTPAGDDGERVIDASAAKPPELKGQQGPQIRIGIALGGMDKPKELPEVIDITPIPDKASTE